MLPQRPPHVSQELWELELPSILGEAHASAPDDDDQLEVALPVAVEQIADEARRGAGTPHSPHSVCSSAPSASGTIIDCSSGEEAASPDRHSSSMPSSTTSSAL